MKEQEASTPDPSGVEAGTRRPPETGPRSRPGRGSGFFSTIGRHELGVLLVLLGITAGTWIFFQFAGRVMDGSTRHFDESIVLAMRSPADASEPAGPAWVKTMARDFTSLGGIAVLALATIASAIFLALQRKTGAMRLLLLAVTGGWILMVIFKRGFDRPRPEVLPLEALPLSASFPSGHSMMAAVTWLTLAVIIGAVESGAWIKAFLLLLAAAVTFAVGVSRVYLGVHWPSDVIAGWALGFMWATLCWILARWLQRRGKVEPDPREEGRGTPPRSPDHPVNP